MARTMYSAGVETVKIMITDHSQSRSYNALDDVQSSEHSIVQVNVLRT